MSAGKPITDEQEITHLLQEWENERRERNVAIKKLCKQGLVAFVPTFLICLSVLLEVGLKRWDTVPRGVFVVLLPFAAYSVVVIAKMASLFANSSLHEDALTQIRDVRAVAPLLSVVARLDQSLQPKFTLALTRLLPLVKASDASLLDAGRRTILYESLFPGSLFVAGNDAQKKEYRLAALQAIEQIGDDKAITILEKILAYAYENKEIREAAEITLEAMKQRAEHTKQSQTLLRASHDNAADSMLLKPATTHDAEQDNLLRPVI